MSRYCVFIFCIIILSIQLAAQSTKAVYYNTIDNKVFTFSKEKPNAPFDSITNFVNTHFQKQEDRARAYYTWIALNVSYDVEHMNELNVLQTFNVNTLTSYKQNAAEVLLSKKGACEGYSNLMVEFCRASSIPCFLVCGYTKTPGGEIPQMLHAWNVLRIDSAWCMLDITWSSGFVSPENTYVKRFSNMYFLPKPRLFIKDHMPIDPMWQLLAHPFTKKEFETDSLVNAHSPLFNYSDSLRSYMRESEKQRLYLNFMHYYRAEPENKNFARNLDVLNNNLIADKLNLGVLYQADFVALAEKKLSKNPTLKDCKTARALLDTIQDCNQKARILLTNTTAHTKEYESVFNAMHKNIADNHQSLKTNYEYLRKLQDYLKKSK
jgi:hypothetical protein